MKLPNKVITYNESIISKFPFILNLLKERDYYVFELFNRVKEKIKDINEFIETLDCLFALGKIKLDNNSRRLSYVAWDYMW